MEQSLSTKAQRFEKILKQHDVSGKIVEFDTPARTAQQAAEVIGCELDQIVKSLIFFAKEDGRAILVLTAGGNRVSEEVIKDLISSPIGKANAEFVREQTGYAIGGVPPFGHVNRIETLIDEDLLRFNEVWAAGGTPNTVFPISPYRLCEITQGIKVKITD